MKQKQIECINVSMSYDGKSVLKDVNFSLNQGDYLCIVGENGTGKSTLIKGLLSLKNVDEGSIEYLGGVKPSDIGYLPQLVNIKHNFPASVKEVVLSGCLNNSNSIFYKKEQKEMAMSICKKVGIENLVNSSFSSLSGGQKQRVLLARALLAASKILLLDEPMASLDPVATGEMYDLIAKLNEEGLTIIMVSHDIIAATKNASHILHLKHKPLFFGEKRDYFKSAVGKEFLEGEEK